MTQKTSPTSSVCGAIHTTTVHAPSTKNAEDQKATQHAFELFHLPFFDLVFRAQHVHREHFHPQRIQASTLLNIKTGGCPENCSYCPQSAHYQTGLEKQELMAIDDILCAAKKAQIAGASRFCVGAAWRSLPKRDLETMCTIIGRIKDLGLETCATLGMLDKEQAQALMEAGLDYYNHNIDTSPAYYEKIITTRAFRDRIDTLKNVREVGLKVCCGGIIGMGETNHDRIEMLCVLSQLPKPPESVPINQLIPIPGTPLEKAPPLDPFDFVRTIALARLLMPSSFVRLSAGRTSMSDELQALCFLAGANSIFYGDKLLTASNATPEEDDLLFGRLNLELHDADACFV